MALLREQEGICRGLGIPSKLVWSLTRKAEVLSLDPERWQEAIEAAEPAREVAQRHELQKELREVDRLLPSLRESSGSGE
jgi:hypothetical protein